MIRLGRLTDYAVIVMTCLAREPRGAIRATSDLAAATHLPAATVSKVCKQLAGAGLLTSHRGIKGGYALARFPAAVTVAEIVVALEGPIALAACMDPSSGRCELADLCPVRESWAEVSVAVRGALDRLTLADLTARRRRSGVRRSAASTATETR